MQHDAPAKGSLIDIFNETFKEFLSKSKGAVDRGDDDIDTPEEGTGIARKKFVIPKRFSQLRRPQNPYDDVTLDIIEHETVSTFAFNFFRTRAQFRDHVALQLACRYNWFHVVQLLLGDGSLSANRPQYKDEEWKERRREKMEGVEDSPLIIAAFYNFTRIATYLIEKGANVATVDRCDGKTALHLAAQHGNKELCDKLLSNQYYKEDGGCRRRIDQPDNNGNTALHLAMLSSQRGERTASCEGTAELLVENGASVTLGDRENNRDNRDKGGIKYKGDNKEQGRCALTIAAGEGAHWIIEMLLNKVRKEGKEDEYVLQEKIDEALFFAIQVGDQKTVDTLIRNGANVCALQVSRGTKTMLTPLHVAAISGHKEIVALLLGNKDVDRKAVDSRGMTPFHRACLSGQKKVVALDQWEENEYKDEDQDGNTALMLAIMEGRSKVVQYILGQKKNLINIHAKDHMGRNILHKGVECNVKDTVVLETILCFLTPDEKRELIDEKDVKHDTPLLFAAHYKEESRIKTLTKILKESNKGVFDYQDDKQKTVLLIAAKRGNEKIVQAVLGDDASKAYTELKNQKEKDGNTALHLAAKRGRVDVVKTILTTCEKCTNENIPEVINARNNHGDTPLHLACRENRDECVKQLLDALSEVEKKIEESSKIGAIEKAKAAREEKDALTVVVGESMNHVTEPLVNMQRESEPLFVTNSDDRTCLDEAVQEGHRNISTLVINHERTQISLWKQEPICNMKEMVVEYPCVAKEILDKCHRRTADGVEFLFSILDTIIDEEDVKKGEEKENGFLPMYMKIKMENEDDPALLSHPVTKRLIYRKWNKFGLWFHIIWFLINCIYTCFTTALVVEAKAAANNFSNDPLNFQSIHQAIDIESNSTCLISKDIPMYNTFPWVILIFGVFYLLTQVFHLIQAKSKYFTMSNVLNLLLTVLAFVFILPFIACRFDMAHQWLTARLQWQFGAVSIFLSWISLLFNFRHLVYGIYLEMLVEVLKSLLKLATVFLILIFGFALSFHCILDDKLGFRTSGIAIIKTIVWMIGEVSYDSAFIDEPLMYPKISIVILVIFFIVMNITFINLLVGLAVGDIDGIRENAILILLKEKVNRLDVLHKSLPEAFTKRMREPIHVFNSKVSLWSLIQGKFETTMMPRTASDYKG